MLDPAFRFQPSRWTDFDTYPWCEQMEIIRTLPGEASMTLVGHLRCWQGPELGYSRLKVIVHLKSDRQARVDV